MRLSEQGYSIFMILGGKVKLPFEIFHFLQDLSVLLLETLVLGFYSNFLGFDGSYAFLFNC
jgi:hypothetical protein